jgi:hypothetical protein
MSSSPKIEVVRIGKRWKARPEFCFVRTAKWVDARKTCEVDVVVDQDNVAYGVGGVEATSSVGD